LQHIEVRSAPIHGDPPASGIFTAYAKKSTNAHPPALPWIERKLYDDVRGLFGQPDRVEEVDGVLRVVDLKSGVRQGVMTETQLQQLLLYAHLVLVSAGRIPDQVVLQDVRGIEQSTAVSSEEVERIVELAVQEKAVFNGRVLNGNFVSSPSDAACSYCPFRVICADYWDARNDDWSGNAVRGTVVAVGIDGVDVERNDSVSRARLIGEGTKDAVQGEELVAVDILRAGPGVFRTRWNSAVRRGSEHALE
jgi:hypothetical protein